jgi:hypothetical protein
VDQRFIAILAQPAEKVGSADPPAAEKCERAKVIIQPGSTPVTPLLHLFILTYLKHAAKTTNLSVNHFYFVQLS